MIGTKKGGRSNDLMKAGKSEPGGESSKPNEFAPASRLRFAVLKPPRDACCYHTFTNRTHGIIRHVCATRRFLTLHR